MFQVDRRDLKRFYVVIVCQILVLAMFLSAHFLMSIYYYTGVGYVVVVCNICFCGVIIFQIVSIVLFVSLYVEKEGVVDGA